MTTPVRDGYYSISDVAHRPLYPRRADRYIDMRPDRVVRIANACARGAGDLPLNFHPAAIRVPSDWDASRNCDPGRYIVIAPDTRPYTPIIAAIRIAPNTNRSTVVKTALPCSRMARKYKDVPGA
jgi:hypothetical protein